MSAIPVGGALAGLGGFDLSVLGRRCRHEAVDETAGARLDLGDGPIEWLLVGSGRVTTPADLPHVLKRGGVHLFIGGGRLEIVEGPDAAAHSASVPLASDENSGDW